MAAISTLLNPEEEQRGALPSPVPSSRPTPAPSDADSPTGPPAKKQKLAKDAAIFTKHDVRSPIRYKPHERYGERTLDQLHEWSVYPLGRIGEYRRRIPYSGGKSDFEKKTGRKAFEVYQYTFKVPATQQEFVVMWDYSIGLVRITPFFKCLQYAKTVPSRVIDSNNGLRDLCFSITGGALAAQGYWMPFEAARAVAATFCHSIRHVLVPLFGPDFVHDCIEPADEKFANMKIDPKITRRCARKAEEYLLEAAGGLSRSVTPAAPRLMTATPEPRPAPTSQPAPANNGSIGRWRAVNSDPDGRGAADESYLPSPSSTAMHERARSTPREAPCPPASSLLTSAALRAHERDTGGRGTGWWSDEEAEPKASGKEARASPVACGAGLANACPLDSRPSASPVDEPLARSQSSPGNGAAHSSAVDGAGAARVGEERSALQHAEAPLASLDQPSKEEWAAAWALIRLARDDAVRRLGR